MAPKFIPTVELQYTYEDQRDGLTTPTVTLKLQHGDTVTLPAGTYKAFDLLEAMEMLMQAGLPGKPPSTRNFNDQ